MANPQPDQFTKISNELMEHMPLYKFNGTQLRIILVVLRYTYGFNRKECSLSLSFLSKAICVHREQIKRELTSLINEKVIKVVKEARFDSTREVTFNKDYDEWLTEKSKLKSLQVANKFTGSENDYIQVANNHTQPGSGLDPQERKIKENIKEKSIDDFFESVWKLYPNKKGKASMKAKQKEVLFKIGFDELKRCIERYEESKEDWKAWKDGSTFFNSGYVDYLDKNYVEEDEELEQGQKREYLLPGGAML